MVSGQHTTEENGLASPRQITKIGVVSPEYGLEHVALSLPVSGYEYTRIRELPIHRLEREGSFWKNTPVLIHPKAPLIHTFNLLPFNGKRFITSFELELPRYLGRHRAWQHNIGHRLMRSSRCRALLGLSEIAAKTAHKNLSSLGFEDIAEKICVFRGAVPLSTVSTVRQPREQSSPLRLLFIGSDGFRKGIIPLLDATEELRASGIEIELTVVSSLAPQTYALRNIELPFAETRSRLESLPWINYFPRVANSEVRSLMTDHDLFVFPSLDESLGWVIIEAGMEGLPSITTNIFAFPELVEDGTTGRMIEIELNHDRRWAGLFSDNLEEMWQQTQDTIRGGIISTVEELYYDRELVAVWGNAARSKMESLYHPEVAAQKLNKIYDKALKKDH